MNSKVLILGAKGMLGHTLFKIFSNKVNSLNVIGTIRDEDVSCFAVRDRENIISKINVLDFSKLTKIIEEIKPDVIINCVGIIKQLKESKDPLLSLEINSLLPHRLAKLCEKLNIRLVCISTDCVFDGEKGYYSEEDRPTPTDLYGRSKLLGEVLYSPNSITLRTSLIGHELFTKNSLLDWFLSQENKANGYTNAVFSGFTTLEFSNILFEKVLPNSQLSGLLHVASNPISKFDLLKKIAEVYKKNIEIMPYKDFYCNRVLISDKFNKLTNYTPPSWESMINNLYDFYSNETQK